MRKLLINWLAVDPFKTARLLFPLGIILGLFILFSDESWNFITILLSVLMGVILFISFIYFKLFPLTPEELKDYNN